MSEKKLTIAQILKALEGMDIPEGEKVKIVQKLLNENIEQENVKNIEDAAIEQIETVEAPINFQDTNSENKSFKSKFWSLGKSFVPFFSSKYENKQNYVEKTQVTVIEDKNSSLSQEKQKSFIKTIKDNAYLLGVTVSHFGNNIPGSTLGKKFISIMKFNGEAKAVSKLETKLKQVMQENNLESSNNADVNLLIKEVVEKDEAGKIIEKHSAKNKYHYEPTTGALVFDSYADVSTNEKLNHVRRNFSHNLKNDLDATIKYLEALSNGKNSKNISLLNSYAKDVDIFPDEVMNILQKDTSGANLPDHPLLSEIIKNRIEILNESISFSNEMVKTRVKHNHLVILADKLLNYVRDLPNTELTESNKELKKHFIIDLANRKFGLNKLSSLISSYKDESNKNIQLNIAEGNDIKKTKVEEANDIVANLGVSIDVFISDVNEIYKNYESYNNKIKKYLEIEENGQEVTKEQLTEIFDFKKQLKDYLIKYTATYQSFGEKYREQEENLTEKIGMLRAAKHYPPKEGSVSKRDFAKADAKAKRHNSDLLSGASNSVLHIVNTTGSLGRISEQMINHITKECGLKFRNFNKLDEDYKKLMKKFPSPEEITNKKLYSRASDLMVSFKELNEIFFKLEDNISKSNRNFTTLLASVTKIEETNKEDLRKSSVSNTFTKIKNSIERYEEDKKLLEKEFNTKFAVFRNLYVSNPNAKTLMKHNAETLGIDMRSWIDQVDPLKTLTLGFNLSKSNSYKRIDEKYSKLLESKEKLSGYLSKLIENSKKTELVEPILNSEKVKPVRIRKPKKVIGVTDFQPNEIEKNKDSTIGNTLANKMDTIKDNLLLKKGTQKRMS